MTEKAESPGGIMADDGQWGAVNGPQPTTLPPRVRSALDEFLEMHREVLYDKTSNKPSEAQLALLDGGVTSAAQAFCAALVEEALAKQKSQPLDAVAQKVATAQTALEQQLSQRSWTDPAFAHPVAQLLKSNATDVLSRLPLSELARCVPTPLTAAERLVQPDSGLNRAV